MNLLFLKKPATIVIFLLTALLVVLGGCNLSEQSSVPEVSEEKLTIATSFYPVYIMALNVTKGVPDVELINIAPSDVGCIHDIQLSTSDLKTLEKSDIFIINGLGMESYMDKVLGNIPELQVIDTTADLDLPALPESHEEHVNPHTWLNVSLAIEQVQKINEQLCILDPENKDQYNQNTEEYVEKLRALKTKMENSLSNLPNKNIVIFQDAFAYFAEEFGLNIVSVLQSEHGSEPSAKELAETIEKIRENDVKAIFITEESMQDAAQTIAAETEAKVYKLDPATIGPSETDAYISAMEQNLSVLQEALSE